MAADERDVANPNDVREAIERLTVSDLNRLRRFAVWRMGALGGLARGRSHEDLLQEAITATLELRRSWRKGEIDFVRHLVKNMESISDNWRSKKDFAEILESDLLPADSEHDEDHDLLGAAAPRPADQESQVIAKQQLGDLRAGLAGDTLALDVLEAMQVDLTGPEIKELLSISETQLQSSRRKIQRHAKVLLGQVAKVAPGSGA